jgi:hypothetical protein
MGDGLVVRESQGLSSLFGRPGAILEDHPQLPDLRDDVALTRLVPGEPVVKASEGAWLEVGAALLAIVPSGQEGSVDKQRKTLDDPMAGPRKKVEAVMHLFGRQDLFAHISNSSGVRPQDLRLVQVWSDSVRDSRNTIHFGVSPSMPNTYEKVAAHLIGAASYMKTLYAVKAAAEASAAAP